MSAFPSLPLFTDAFIADTGHLSAQETGAYLMLLMVAWRSPECRLVDEDDKLARWARVDRRTWLRIKPTVMEFWVLRDGFWTQKRLAKERDIVSKRADAARQNGRHGGRPKSLSDNDPSNPPGSSRDSGSKAPNPNPSPTPSKNSSLRSEGVARSRGPEATAIDPDWTPDERDVDAAITEGVPRTAIPREARQYVDWYLERGVTSHDWRASWRRWCRSPYRADSIAPSGPLSRPPPPRQPTGNVARSIELKRLIEEREHGNREADDGRGDDQPGATRGEDRGVAWTAGGGGRPAESVLRAARSGAFDRGEAAALRRRTAPRGAA